MKVLKSKIMRKLLAAGKRKKSKIGAPRVGSSCSLIYRTLPNGWHYQVDYIHDSRFYERPAVFVYAFAPGRGRGAVSADYVLSEFD